MDAADFPAKLEDYLAKMRDQFAQVDCTLYKKLDKDIGDALHQVYKDKCGGAQELARSVFGILQSDLGAKKTLVDAKNYKKLLAAIQKSKLLHPAEITELFNKTKRFLGKEAVKKEKEKIKKEVIENLLVDGVRPKQDQSDSKSQAELEADLIDEATNMYKGGENDKADVASPINPESEA